tara:strand:- start:3 stop:482 length:480 start_codon:yes stop_codon:yes gene_type:complete
MIQIIDNFLPAEEFKSIQSFLMGGEFNWFYQKGAVERDDGSFHMTHMFYQPQIGPNSEDINIWNTFMNQVEAKKCERIKANLIFKTPTHESTEYHCDYRDMKTAIFYINTNNGYTEFKNGVKVSCVSNRVCIFDSNLKHRGVSHTEGDQQRIVVNFNYA